MQANEKAISTAQRTTQSSLKIMLPSRTFICSYSRQTVKKQLYHGNVPLERKPISI